MSGITHPRIPPPSPFHRAPQGVFCFPAGNDRTVLQFLPPLVLTDDEADDLIDRMKKAFA